MLTKLSANPPIKSSVLFNWYQSVVADNNVTFPTSLLIKTESRTLNMTVVVGFPKKINASNPSNQSDYLEPSSSFISKLKIGQSTKKILNIYELRQETSLVASAETSATLGKSKAAGSKSSVEVHRTLLVKRSVFKITPLKSIVLLQPSRRIIEESRGDTRYDGDRLNGHPNHVNIEHYHQSKTPQFFFILGISLLVIVCLLLTLFFHRCSRDFRPGSHDDGAIVGNNENDSLFESGLPWWTFWKVRILNIWIVWNVFNVSSIRDVLSISVSSQQYSWCLSKTDIFEKLQYLLSISQGFWWFHSIYILMLEQQHWTPFWFSCILISLFFDFPWILISPAFRACQEIWVLYPNLVSESKNSTWLVKFYNWL